MITFHKSKEIILHFVKSNWLSLPSLFFFRDCSYLLYDINREKVPASIFNQFTKTSLIHNHREGSIYLTILFM